MYQRFEEDDDSDSIYTRGQDLRNRLRCAVQAARKIEDPAARESVAELIDAIRIISEVLYDLCEAPQRRLVAPNLDPYRIHLS